MTLIEIRRNKINQFNYSYPNSSRTHSINECFALFDKANLEDISINKINSNNSKIVISGRIKFIRKSGGISFIKIFDTNNIIQIILTKSFTKNYNQIQNFDLGDIVDAIGTICVSSTNEKSLLVEEIVLLSKCINPLPDKYNGICNEDKYINREANYISDEESRNIIKYRSFIVNAIRSYFLSNDFIEIETPILQKIASGANAKPFETFHNSMEKDLFLRIAPEINLKKMLISGFDKIFEIGKNFRNEGVSNRHNPEFTMIEFYESYKNYNDLINRTIDLFKYIDFYLENNCNILHNYFKNKRTFSIEKIEFISMQDSVANAINKGREFKNHHLNYNSNGEKLYAMFEEMVEPYLEEDYSINGKSIPVAICDFPKEICPLAKIKSSDNELCNRFELYINGKELCNAFEELNNPIEQESRFIDQASQKDSMQIDNSFISAMNYGMPPAIGFGMGIDRLVMAFTNSYSIKDVISFPY